MREKLIRLLNEDHKILFVGIGNVLKHDDGVGVYICDRIISNSNIQTLSVEQSIENYIGKINSMNADRLVLVDSVFFNRYPGYTDLLPVNELIDHTTHTHNISLNKTGELFKMPVDVLGIQPGDVSFGEGLTPQVKKMADEIVGYINKRSGLTF